MVVEVALLRIANPLRKWLDTMDIPALAPFLADWPAVPLRVVVSDTEPRSAPAAPSSAAAPPSIAALPVLSRLDDFSRDAHRVGAPVIEALHRDAAHLVWRQTYTAAELGEHFVHNYGYTEIVGTRSIDSARLAAGFLLLGPHTHYPRHRHEAEEIYIPLSGTAQWQQSDEPWHENPPGALIHHRSDEPHATKTGTEPLLALYLWRSNHLNQKARLEPNGGAS